MEIGKKRILVNPKPKHRYSHNAPYKRFSVTLEYWTRAEHVNTLKHVKERIWKLSHGFRKIKVSHAR